MSDINVVTISGRLTRDPKFVKTPSGNQVAEFRMANNVRDKTNFFDVSVWGKSAETISEYVDKGRWISVTGRMEMREWEDKETGQMRTAYSIVTDNFTFLGPRQKDSEESSETESTGKVSF
jgi:single-strand DNA-binding protein